ncbi:uncharacterized protein B0H64DRAFT_407178 [Chaetomium fimeti]|uniref:Uncharacterized protein n=1 Tax=Chaetomium fimeti TaxID=1854472 RepID=A0AAE0H9V9_9PEZI|nr:hypothetical protein B0H64DRAFT_407178 [Chaetomium fimeti]
MDFNFCLAGDQFKHAVTNAARYFAEPASSTLRHKVVAGNYGILEVLNWTVFNTVFTNPNLKFDKSPASISEFLSLVEPIFSSSFLAEINAQARAFDAVAGITGLSDVFIEARPAREAIRDLIQSIAVQCAKEAVEAVPLPGQTEGTAPQPPATKRAATSPTLPPLPPPAPTEALPDTDSPLDQGPRCSLVQIDLEGTAILDAWGHNATTREMERIALSAGPSATPSSPEFKALPVYHGTDSFCTAVWEEQDTALQTGALAGHSRDNQVVPTSNRLPVVWTGFSPLRSFLWAAFLAEVLSPVPTGVAKQKLQSPWSCRDHTHTGVLLFKFRPTLPSALGQSVYVLPKGREAQWNTIRSQTKGKLPSTSLNTETAVKYMWDMFSSIHGGATNSWPNALHCHEYGEKLRLALPWTLWRTVWFAEGIEALNSSHEVTYVISFKEAVSNPSVPQGGESRDKRGSFRPCHSLLGLFTSIRAKRNGEKVEQKELE